MGRIGSDSFCVELLDSGKRGQRLGDSAERGDVCVSEMQDAYMVQCLG